MVAFSVDKIVSWKGLDYMPAPTPPLKKITWEKISPDSEDYTIAWQLGGWIGSLTCKNFSFKEYENMANWAKEVYGNGVYMSYGVTFSASDKDDNKDGRIMWIKADPLPAEIYRLKIHFKNKSDAVAFKLTWAGDTT